jgi:hypothetical protein
VQARIAAGERKGDATRFQVDIARERRPVP